MVFARLSLSDYSNKTLNVIKARFGLKDKSDALNRFIEMYGDEIVEKEAKEEFLKEVINSCNAHIKKYGSRKMSIKELDRLCGIK